MQAAELPTKGDQLVRGEPLPPKEQDEVAVKGLDDIVEDGRRRRDGEVEADDLGPERPAAGRDGDGACLHVRRP